MPCSNDPESVVQRQLDAFNARDIDALLAVYAEDAHMFEHPSKLLASGSAALRERYTARFQEPNLHATLLKRIVMGNVVIDHEDVARTFPEGPGKIALIMIYEVEHGRIARAWSIPGAKTFDPMPQGFSLQEVRELRGLSPTQGIEIGIRAKLEAVVSGHSPHVHFRQGPTPMEDLSSSTLLGIF